MMKDTEGPPRLQSGQNWLQGRKTITIGSTVSRRSACPWGANLNYTSFSGFLSLFHAPTIPLTFTIVWLDLRAYLFCHFFLPHQAVSLNVDLPTWPPSLFSPGLCLDVLLEVCGGSSPLSSFLLTQPTWLLS